MKVSPKKFAIENRELRKKVILKFKIQASATGVGQ